MSDALTTDSALDRTSQDGQSDQASAEAQATAEKSQASSKPKVNLHDLPEYREVQSKYDRERAQMQQQMQQQNQLIQQLQRQMADAEDRSAPDDYTRLELRLRREQQEKAAMLRQLQEVQQEREAQRAREDALGKIATKYGVPRGELESAANYEEAMDAAIAYLTQAKQRKQDEDDDRRERNKPDIGGGKTSTPAARLQREYQEAQERRDSVAMVRLKRLMAAQQQRE